MKSIFKVVNNYEDKVEKIFDNEQEAQKYIESKCSLDDKYSLEEERKLNHKSILMSIQPKWVCEILNGRKTIEVRRKFPKDYVGWVYIYCTKGENNYHLHQLVKHPQETYYYKVDNVKGWNVEPMPLNGKVVARFWCDKVEEMYTDENGMSYYTDTIKEDYMVSKLACLDDSDIENYLGGKIGYAIHISKLEIFDRPKELSEFYCNYTHNDYKKGVKTNYIKEPNILMKKLTKAPQNYCYIEGE